MPLLYTSLVEVHREYERQNRAAKDMAEEYKNATATANRLQEQCAKRQADNTGLSENFDKQKKS